MAKLPLINQSGLKHLKAVASARVSSALRVGKKPIEDPRDSLWIDPVLTVPATTQAQQLAKTLGIAGDVAITKEIYRTIMAVAVNAVIAKIKG